MPLLRLLPVCLLAAACGAGEPPGPHDAPPAATEEMASGSLALTLALDARCEGLEPCPHTPTQAPLWVALAGRHRLRVSSPADVIELQVTSGTARAGRPFLLEHSDLGAVTLDALGLQLLDTDADGVMDVVHATGSGTFSFQEQACAGAAGHGSFIAAEISATPYDTPTIAVDDAVWPASGIPVRSAGSALLVTAAEARVGNAGFPLDAPADRTVAIALGPAPFPFDAEGELELAVEDLAGRRLDRRATFHTAELLPGSFDGSFESRSLGGMAARNVVLVDRELLQNFLPGAGKTSAYTRDGAVTFPVRVPAGGGFLSFHAWALNQPGAVELRIATADGVLSRRFPLEVTEDVTDVPVFFQPGTLQATSRLLDVQQDLQPYAGSTVVVEIRLEGPPPCAIQGEFAGFLLDDLTLP